MTDSPTPRQRRPTMADCPNAKRHTKCPEGYLAWHEWAEKKARTHEQVICGGCGRLAIWIKKEVNDG